MPSLKVSSLKIFKLEYPQLDYPQLEYFQLEYLQLEYPQLEYLQPVCDTLLLHCCLVSLTTCFNAARHTVSNCCIKACCE